MKEYLKTSPTTLHKQLNGLYDLLLERMLDVSSYVHTKVLSVLSKLCDLPVKFPKQRLAVHAWKNTPPGRRSA